MCIILLKIYPKTKRKIEWISHTMLERSIDIFLTHLQEYLNKNGNFPSCLSKKNVYYKWKNTSYE